MCVSDFWLMECGMIKSFTTEAQGHREGTENKSSNRCFKILKRICMMSESEIHFTNKTWEKLCASVPLWLKILMLNLERHPGYRNDALVGKIACAEFVIPGNGNHGSVVGAVLYRGDICIPSPLFPGINKRFP